MFAPTQTDKQISWNMPANHQRRSKLIFLAIVAALAFYFCYLIARPFLQPVVAAGILATLFHPWFRRLERKFSNANWAAALSLIILIVAFVGPAFILGMLLEKEIAGAYQWLKQNTAAQNGWPAALSFWIDRAASWIGIHTGVSPEALRNGVLSRVDAASGAMVKKTADILSGIGAGIVSLVIMLVTFFFLLREGKKIVRGAAGLLPLSAEEIDRLIASIDAAIQANVVGVLAVAAAQGSLLGLALWVLGLSSPLLWALIAAICSVIPLVGSAVVWVPATIYLFITGSWIKGLILLGWSAGVVSLADNIIRPWILSGRVNLSPLVLFFALLGGVDVFGPLGIFLGPLIVSLAVTFGAMFFAEFRQQEELEADNQAIRPSG
jgi:predicted PurR-regulated permease PerM